jgi:hypothetical protein
MHRSIHSSTEGSRGLRNRLTPGPACFGPGNFGVTLETGQMAMQVAQRIQTSELFWSQLCFFITHQKGKKGTGYFFPYA